MRATVLHNPTAGPGDVSTDELLDVVGRAGFTPRYTSAKDLEFSAALQDAADLVVVAGGDGTVGKVVRHLRDRTIPITILPLGGANNIATSLGISGDWRDLPGQWASAPRCPLDVGVAYGPWGRWLFIEGIGLGALPLAAIKVSQAKVSSSEKSRCGLHTLAQIVSNMEPMQLRVTVDGVRLPERLLLIEIMNIGMTGPGLPLAPDADSGDGLFDIVCIEVDRRTDMLAWIEGRLQARAHRAPPPAVSCRASRLTLEWERTPLHVDDSFPSAPEQSCRVTVAVDTPPMSVVVPRG